MANKYQDSLSTIKEYLFLEVNVHEFDLIKCVDTLQELIDKYEASVQFELDRRYRNLIKYLDKHCENWRSDIANGD